MSDETIQALVYALLGTGGATFIWTIVRSVIAYRDSAEGREDKAIARLEKFEEGCREQLAFERAMGNYWATWSASLEFAMVQAGLELPPRPARPTRLDQEWRLPPAARERYDRPE